MKHKHVAIILAGGVGSRMGADIPKQFLEVNGRPVIVHTIMNFQKHPEISGIVVVCIDEWMDYLNDIVEKYQLTKVEGVVAGGATVHDSTRNGLYSLKNKISDGDYVIIHDSARPVLPAKAIDEMITVAHEHGNASLAIPCHETVIYTDDQKSGVEQLDRSKLMRVQTPQAYEYGFIRRLYERSDEDGIHDIIYADLVAIHYGERVYFSKGFTNNVKITKREDIALVESLMGFSEEQLFSL